jgi:hypothetical protein
MKRSTVFHNSYNLYSSCFSISIFSFPIFKFPFEFNISSLWSVKLWNSLTIKIMNYNLITNRNLKIRKVRIWSLLFLSWFKLISKFSEFLLRRLFVFFNWSKFSLSFLLVAIISNKNLFMWIPSCLQSFDLTSSWETRVRLKSRKYENADNKWRQLLTKLRNYLLLSLNHPDSFFKICLQALFSNKFMIN